MPGRRRAAAEAGAPRLRQWNSIARTKEVLVKFCLDGFSVERFFRKESHFQLGYALVMFAGQLVVDCCSRLAFRPLAKALAKEEVAIPLVLKELDEQFSVLDMVQLPDTSIRVRMPGVPGASNNMPRWVKPVFSMDFKAWALALDSKGAAAIYFCCYNKDCSSHNSKRRVEKVETTTTLGDLRRCGKVAEEDYMEVWRPRERAAGRQGEGANGQVIKDDYHHDCHGQNMVPLLLPCFPDNVLLLVLCVIEPLHCMIQVLNHFCNYLFIKCHIWSGETWPNRTLMRKRKDGEKEYLSPNEFLPPRYTRPMMGYAGMKPWTMMREAETWLEYLFVRRETFTVFVGQQPYKVTLEWRHEQFEAMVQQFRYMHELMRLIFELRPSDREIGSFGDYAVEAGQHLLDKFEDYEMSPYEHWLHCHMWHFMEYHRGVGKLSSIVAEAANALWKDIAVNHDASHEQKSESALIRMAAITNPNVAFDDYDDD